MLLKLFVVAFVSGVFSWWFSRPRLSLNIAGEVSPDFENVKEVFRSLLKSGELSGGSFAVYQRDKLIVDLWGGYANPYTEQKWKKDTISITQSTTKAIAALCIGILVSRGKLGYDEKIGKYWPEFNQNGKQDITVRMLLEHTAGIVALDEPLRLENLTQNPAMVLKVLEKQRPLWKPGSKQGYHSVTYGLYVAHLVKLVDSKHRNIDEFLNEEISARYDIDFKLRLPKSEFYRKALFWQHNILQNIYDLFTTSQYRMLGLFLDSGSLIQRSSVGTIIDIMDPGSLNTPDILTAILPSVLGFGNARSLAAVMHYTVSSPRGRDAVHEQLLAKNVLDEFKFSRKPKYDETIGHDTQSYAVGMMQDINPQGNMIFGHVGYGGQALFRDTKNDLTYAFVTNDMRMYPPNRDTRVSVLVSSVYRCLENKT